MNTIRITILACLLVVITGCSTLERLTGGSKSVAPIVTRTNVTETVVVTPATSKTVDSPSGPVTVVVPSTSVTNWQTNVVAEVNPLWQQTISGARTLNSTLNPTPTGPIIHTALGLLVAGLGWFARFKTKRLEQTEQERSKAQGLLNTVIAGVEAAKNPEVKTAIAETAKLWGTSRELAAHVQQVTTDGPNPK